MRNRIQDGVLINLLQIGASPGTIDHIARRFMEQDGRESVSRRYKKAVARFSIEDLDPDPPALGGDGLHRLFGRHYWPRVYWIFGFFDLAILQLCDSLELIPELTALPRVTATQNIFGLRSTTHGEDGAEHGSLELCSPLLPLLFICNVKVHPLVQLTLGQDLHGLLNLHFRDFLEEAEVMRRAGEDRAELMTLTVVDTYGWNELTFLIHGTRFDRMFQLVSHRIRELSLRTLVEGLAPDSRERWRRAIDRRFEAIAGHLEVFRKTPFERVELWSTPLFSYTDTIPGIDYGLARRLNKAPTAGIEGSESLLDVALLSLRERATTHCDPEGRYLGALPPEILEAALARMRRDMKEDEAGCHTGFSLRPGADQNFLLGLQGVFDVLRESHAAAVLGPYDLLVRQVPGEEGEKGGGTGSVLSRLQRIVKSRVLQQVQAAEPAEGSEMGESTWPPLTSVGAVLASKTSICFPLDLSAGGESIQPEGLLGDGLPQVFRYWREPDSHGRFDLQWACQRIRLPKPLQISLENTLEPFHSFLDDQSLFSQYLDLYFPLLLICQRIQQAAADFPANQHFISEQVSNELRQFNHAFQARFRSSYLRSESTETTLEFKAHTVTPLDSIQCIVDCLTGLFGSFSTLAGFPVISVSSRPRVHASPVFAVELNSFQLQFPETLPVLFHEFGHLYCRYGGLPRSEELARRAGRRESCLWEMMSFEVGPALMRWQSFASLTGLWDDGQTVSPSFLRERLEEVVSDLLLLTTICRGHWDLHLWYTLLQIETFPDCFHNNEGPQRRTILYPEFLARLFLVRAFWKVGRSTLAEDWQRELSEKRFREFARQVRDRSRKIREFYEESAKSNLDLDTRAWRLLNRLVQAPQSLEASPPDGRTVRFLDNRHFWRTSLSAQDIESHPGLGALFLGLAHALYHRMLEDQVSIAMEPREEAELREAFERVGVSPALVDRGAAPVTDLLDLLGALAWDEALDPAAYLQGLRDGSQELLRLGSPGAQPPHPARKDESCRAAYARGFARVTRALFALLRFFHAENTRGPEPARYLYRDEETGRPEAFEGGMSPECRARGIAEPLPIVLDSRGGLFCRSTAARQTAFQFRNAVLRELADAHYKLRPVKMAEMHRIASRYVAELEGGGEPREGS